MSHKYDKDTEYHRVAYHTLLRQFMIFWQGDYSNLEYKQRFKEQMEVLEAYNWGFLFEKSPGSTEQEIATLGLDAEIRGDVEKAQVSARGKYLATAFSIRSNMRLYKELILSLKNEYTKHQKNYPKYLTDMNGLMVMFELTRLILMSRGRNEGMNFGNVTVKPRTGGDGDH